MDELNLIFVTVNLTLGMEKLKFVSLIVHFPVEFVLQVPVPETPSLQAPVTVALGIFLWLRS